MHLNVVDFENFIRNNIIFNEKKVFEILYSHFCHSGNVDLKEGFISTRFKVQLVLLTKLLGVYLPSRSVSVEHVLERFACVLKQTRH